MKIIPSKKMVLIGFGLINEDGQGRIQAVREMRATHRALRHNQKKMEQQQIREYL